MAWRTLSGDPPAIIAHRGASGYRPEHTLASYALAIEQGADLIEPDLVPSRDGILYARHDRGLSRSTDVAQRPEFAARARFGRDGVRDFWIDDFDSAELATLRCIQPFAGRDRGFDGRDPVPRFEAVLALAAAESRRRGRRIGVYPELKQPATFASLGRDVVALATRAMQAEPEVATWIQCFDHAALARWREASGRPAFALVGSDDPVASRWAALGPELRDRGCSGLALDRRLLFDAGPTPACRAIAALHEQGLAVHAWTFRQDLTDPRMPSATAELVFAFACGVDALFCDFPDRALAARAAHAGRG